MARPALSASRSIEIIDFLAAFPGRAFTLSEIARAAKINVTSCHAVLNALTDRGYLTRNQKTYALGPALVAIGQAALTSQPLVVRAREAGRTLSGDLHLPVLLTALVGDEILAIDAIPDPSGRSPGMRVGQRVPLVPPVGAPFLAWSSEAEIQAWAARMAPAGDGQFVERWSRDLALVRKRGFQVTLRLSDSVDLATVMAEMASSRKAPEYRDHVIELIHSMDERIFHPISLDAQESYQVALIAAPIFDQSGAAAFTLCIVNFPGKITGAMIKIYGEKLIQTSLQIMRHDRAA